MTFTDTFTSVQGQVLEGLATVQAPVVDAVKQAAETIDGLLPADRPTPSFATQLPQPADLVELGFGFAQKVLDNQHDFAKAIVKAVSPLLPAAPKAPAKPKVVKTAA
jgi:hypothetical protein